VTSVVIGFFRLVIVSVLLTIIHYHLVSSTKQRRLVQSRESIICKFFVSWFVSAFGLFPISTSGFGLLWSYRIKAGQFVDSFLLLSS
jgi:integral membrane sensor domain MASE1